MPSILVELTTSSCQLQQENNKTLHGLLISSPQVISVGSLSRDPFDREVTKYLSVNLDSPLSYGIPDTTEELPCSLLTLKHRCIRQHLVAFRNDVGSGSSQVVSAKKHTCVCSGRWYTFASPCHCFVGAGESPVISLFTPTVQDITISVRIKLVCIRRTMFFPYSFWLHCALYSHSSAYQRVLGQF